MGHTLQLLNHWFRLGFLLAGFRIPLVADVLVLSDEGPHLVKCKCLFSFRLLTFLASLRGPCLLMRIVANLGVLALGADFSYSPKAVFPTDRMNTARVCKMILGGIKMNILIATHLCIWKKRYI